MPSVPPSSHWMREFLRASAILFQMHLRTTLASRRFLVCALLAAAPVAFATLIATVVEDHEEIPLHLMTWMPIGQVVCPVIALVFGSAVVSEEISDRTITYLFSRPIPRPSVLLGRWLAALVPAFLLLAGSTLGVVAILTLRFENAVGRDTVLGVALPVVLALLLGVAAYSAAFAVLGALTKHSIAIGLGYVFAFELLLVNAELPGNLQRIAVQHHMRSLVKDLVTVWSESRLFGRTDLVQPETAAIVLLSITLVALAAGAATIVRRQYELTA